MSKREFFHSTPSDIMAVIEAHNSKMKLQTEMIEYNAWLTGVYVLNAIGCSFSKHAKFPDCPISSEKKTVKEIAEANGKTEQELQQELRFMSLCVDQANAEIKKVKMRRTGRQGG